MCRHGVIGQTTGLPIRLNVRAVCLQFADFPKVSEDGAGGRGVRARLFLTARRFSGKRSGGFSVSAAFGRFAPFQKNMELMKIDFQKMGLVLEGGGMRGVFTCGVLDFMMDRHIEFPYAVGVSAGACNGLSYMSHQRGRAKYSNIDMLEKYRYIGLKYLWNQHSILDQHLLYDLFPNEILPYDYEAYRRNPARFEMVTTNCVTGLPCYLEEKDDSARLIDIVKASSSLPYVCPVAYVDGRPMLDGGIVDSIPVLRAVSQGYETNVVVMTRHKGYRKTEKDIRVPGFIYRRYPKLRLALSRRCQAYNEQLELVERMEDEGKILAVRPEKPVAVNRIEKDIRKLTDLYNEGYACAEKVLSPYVPG